MIDLIQPLEFVATAIGVVALFVASLGIFCGLALWCFKRVMLTFKVYMHFSCYIRDVIRGKVHMPVSMVIVTADDSWQACYLQGRKFFEAERMSPWDEGMRRAGCTVTNRWAKQSWLDARGGSYPQNLKEVEFNDVPN